MTDDDSHMLDLMKRANENLEAQGKRMDGLEAANKRMQQALYRINRRATAAAELPVGPHMLGALWDIAAAAREHLS